MAASNEIQITRVYHASLKNVWAAWTDPNQLENWWGPRGFKITTHKKDLRAGGIWDYTMHGPDGANYPNKTKYLEVVPESKLVYDHGGHDERAPLFRVTVYFTENQGKTTMQMSMALPSAEALEETRKLIRAANGNSTWDRLAEHLEKQTTGKEIFVINRTFDAPQDRVFELWADPKHSSQWLSPKGSKLEYFRSDVKPGGSTFYSMSGQGSEKMYGRAEYIKVQKPALLTYIQQFCNENEEISRHPLAPTWPETMLTTVEFSPESSNRTRITVTWQPQGPLKPVEIETFINSRSGMNEGWTGSFGQLEDYLKKKP